MAFSTGIIDDFQAIGAGEVYTGSAYRVLSASTFEDDLNVGRFAKMDTASLDNMDGSSSPVIAGVVLRNPANTYEDGTQIDTDLHEVAEFAVSGIVSVAAKAGETPTWGDSVYASNGGDTNDGLATVTDTDEATRGKYLETLDTNLWLIELV